MERRGLLKGGLTAAVLPAAARAQTGAGRPLTIVVPYTPGASTDVVVRVVARHASQSLGQPVIVENRPAGGGTAAAMAVRIAVPDGNTLLLGHAGIVAILPSLIPQPPYDPLRDFRTVTNLFSFPHVLVVPATSSARTVTDLATLARSKPEAVSYASQGVGSGGHVLGEMFSRDVGARLLHVPYAGAAPALLDTVSGRVDLLFASYISANAYIREGKLRVLGFTSTHRSRQLPEVPTMAEAGFPDVVLEYWFGLLAPAGTPDGVVDRLNATFQAAANVEEVRRLVLDQDADIVTGSPAHFARTIAEDIPRIGGFMRSVGARLD